MESVANGEQLRTQAEQLAGDLDAAYERLTLGIEYLRSTAEPDWQDVLAHLKLARQCLGRDPGNRVRDQLRASGVWQGRMNMACLRLDRHAEGRAGMGHEVAARAYRKAADIVGEEYHAALCDLAGGES